MSAADFLLSKDVQKVLSVIYSRPEPNTVEHHAEKVGMSLESFETTLAHLTGCGLVVRIKDGEDPNADALIDNPASPFGPEFRSFALKTFAFGEPLRKLLLAKFLDTVVCASILGEDWEGRVELLLVHGKKALDEKKLQTALQRLCNETSRDIQVTTMDYDKYIQVRDDGSHSVHKKLASSACCEVLGAGESRAQIPTRWTTENGKRVKVWEMVGPPGSTLAS